jgi:hypothetical protein
MTWLVRAPATRLVVAVTIAVLAFVGVLAGEALARPGGGDSYSGGGGHGGGGGGDGDGLFELIYWLIRLSFYYPEIGLPLLGGVIAYVVYSSYKQHQNKDWDSGPPVELARAVELDGLRELDPDFSPVVFEDFVFRLFSAAHRERGKSPELEAVAPYVSAAARRSLAERQPVGVAVEQVIVGAMRVYRVSIPPEPLDAEGRAARVCVGIELEANVLAAKQTYFSVERWQLARDATRTSKPPDPARGLPCPNCGAPWQATATGSQECASCHQVVDNGRFDWLVEDIVLRSLDERPPTLTTDVPERGTDLPTYRQARVDERFAELRRDDPAVDEAALQARLATIYIELGKAWSANDLTPVRGFVSDGLYDYLQYWVDAYKRQGLRNQLTDMQILRIELAKVARDRWYHAVTIRLWGTGRDFVVDEKTGDLVRGSKHRFRRYSEYWTLIRSASRKGPARADRGCGNCGAPLEVTMAGACHYCGAHVTAGEFDWVLSKIEQDDSYRG